jgi:2-desacetyl-2-hydroxyethyl bacteriochlorophyllide A dehydrogenase
MQMRALAKVAEREIGFVELPAPPEPGPTQILIETAYSGITNGTERHCLVGEFGSLTFPAFNGYQQVGQIVALGDKARGFEQGDWVFYGQYVGHRGWNLVDVAFNVPAETCWHNVVRIPGALEPKYCGLLGVAGVALRAVRRLRVGLGQKVWVVGAGLIGQFAAQAARCAGGEVLVSDVNPARLKQAMLCGARSLVNATEQDAWEQLRAAGPFDVIIDCSSLKSLLWDIAANGLMKHGTVIGLIAVRPEVAFPWGMLHGAEASIEVSCHFGTADIEAVIGYLVTGQLVVEPLITHQSPVDEAPALYRQLVEAPGSLLGVIFDWTGSAE